ncbi:MAG: hypothetical protein IJM59_13220 [Proteobacteria bacterium]|nr:hypothetical protein [Pseudomonadota bacterium]
MSDNALKAFRGKLAIYSCAHFCVDFACGCLVTSRFWPSPDGLLAVILYNFFAFACQMPIGMIADKWNRNALVSAIGCLIVIAGVGIAAFNMKLVLGAAVIAGIGNAMFHMGGGIDVLNVSGAKSGPLGVFVSPGALGLFLGVAYGQTRGYVTMLPIGLMLACAAVIFGYQMLRERTFVSRNVPLSFRISSGVGKALTTAAIAALFIVVTLRSYVGITQSFEWKSQWHWGIFLIAALVLGKALGGVLSDKFGMRKTACVTLSLAALLYAFSDYPAAGVLAVFCFNMTMPMTLWALSQIFAQAKGFAFGTLTCALFMGFMGTLLFDKPMLSYGWCGMIASILSGILLIIGLKAVRNNNA